MINIHRSRFVDFTPATITAIAFSHKSLPNQDRPNNLKLAVGRSNGDIEIWNPRDNWTHELTIRGGSNRSIEGLVWASQDAHTVRLFSIGSSTAVTEWNLETLQPRLSVDCNAGSIWSLAVSPNQQNLAVGCEDGSLVMLDIAGGIGVIEYDRVLTRQNSRILSLAFKGESELVGGCSDSTVKIWNYAQPRGPIVARMSVDKVRGEATLVWAVLVLRGGTIVSGDSTGSVKFWDKKFYTLQQNFKLHASDVLCLGSNWRGDVLFSAGVDRKLQMYKLVDKAKRRWTDVSGRRFHAHDVRAMTTYESKSSSIVLTGGVDMSLAVIPLERFMKDVHRMLPVTPQRPNCTLSPTARLIMMWSDKQVKIWRLCEPFQLNAEPQQVLVSKMNLSVEEHLTCADLSQDGEFLVIGTLCETKLFRMTVSSTHGSLRPTKIQSETLSKQGARLARFHTETGRLFLVTPNSNVLVFNLLKIGMTEESRQVSLSQPTVIEVRKDQHKKGQTYLSSISHIAISPNGNRIAVCNYGNITHVCDTSTGAALACLPALPSEITAMTFHGNDQLVLTTAARGLYEFDITSRSGQLTPWSVRNSENMPKSFVQILDHCSGLEFDEEEKLWMWGANWICSINFAIALPIPEGQAKRKRTLLVLAERPSDSLPAEDDQDEEGDGLDATSANVVERSVDKRKNPSKNVFWITHRYRPLLLFGLISGTEMVVVERPVLDILAEGSMPPAFYRHRYGT